MKIKDVMTTNVIMVNENEKFHDIIKTFVEHQISGAPVVNNRGEIIGIISENDLISHLFPTQKEFYSDLDYYLDDSHLDAEADNITRLQAKDLMVKDIVSVDPDEDLIHTCGYLISNHLKRLLVMKKGKLIGIVSTRDIYKNFLYNL